MTDNSGCYDLHNEIDADAEDWKNYVSGGALYGDDPNYDACCYD